MLKPKILPRFCLAVTVSAAAFLLVALVAVPSANTEGRSATPPDDSCADLLGFYKPFSPVNKILYWAGNVAARDITSRAIVQYSVPIEELPEGFFSEADNAKVAVNLKGEDDYAVMSMGVAGIVLAQYPKLLEFHSSKYYSQMKANYGLVVSKEEKDSIEKIRGKSIEVHTIISWKQHFISYKTARSDPRIKLLVDADVFDIGAMTETFENCMEIETPR